MVAGRAAVSTRVRDLRAWLDSTLFPEGLRPARLTVDRVAVGVALALAAVAVVLLRLGGVPLDSVWAEDGPVFLGTALANGFPESLTANYAGYLHLLPRVLAELAALVPLDWSAEVLALSASVVAVLCAYMVWIASAGHLPDPRLRGLLATMVLLLPVVGVEALASVSYIQWLVVFPSFWLLLWRPASTIAAVAGAVFVAVALMSAPLALFLAPVTALRAVAIRGSRDLILVAGFAIGALAQVVAILLDDTAAPAAGWRADLPAAYLVRVVGGVVFGQPLEAGLWAISGTLVIGVAAIAFGAMASVSLARRIPGRALSLIAIGFSVFLFLFSGYQRDVFNGLIWPDGESNTLSARYTIIPALFLLTAVVVQIQQRSRPARAGSWTRVRLGVVAAISLAALSSFYVGNERRQTGWSAELERARGECREGGPPAVGVFTSPPGWVVNLPCAKLTG